MFFKGIRILLGTAFTDKQMKQKKKIHTTIPQYFSRQNLESPGVTTPSPLTQRALHNSLATKTQTALRGGGVA